MLEVSNLCSGYGKTQVLHGIDFHVNQGEIVTLVGANGAGKTTTLKTLCGIIHITSGDVKFEGQSIKNKTSYEIVEANITMIPEDRQLFPNFTVQDNLLMGAYKKAARAEAKDSMAQVLDLFPRVKERLGQSAGSLSGGEQQMVAIARGMMARPKLLILDEPSLGLSPLLVRQMFDTIRRITEQHMTVLLVEQNISHTLKLANRGYVLENGFIALQGTGEELLSNPHIKRAYLGQ